MARLWQTLRQSAEKEWAMVYPQYAVSKWVGHSITVSGRHYANSVPDELFAKAAGKGEGEADEPVAEQQESSKVEAAQNAAHYGAKQHETDREEDREGEAHKAENPGNSGVFRYRAKHRETYRNGAGGS